MEETGADIVYPTMHYGDESEHTITPLDKELYAGSHKGKECVKLTLNGWRINCNGGVIRKECYTDTFSTFGSSLTYSCADELLSRQLLFMTPTVAFSPAKYFYRPNCDSITRKNRPNFSILYSTTGLCCSSPAIISERIAKSIYLPSNRTSTGFSTRSGCLTNISSAPATKIMPLPSLKSRENL